jgi:ABC-type branched-subunit amino acid transport system permease subunit
VKLKDIESDESDSHIDRNYLAVTAFILALAGLILSFTLLSGGPAQRIGREMFLGIVGLAGAMCLFIMKFQMESKIARETDNASKYLVIIEFAFGYWITLILFVAVAFLNIYFYMENARKSLSQNGNIVS